MAKQVQFRRGTTAQHSTFTGAAGEVTIDTDKDVVVVHDGTTVGGFPLAKDSAKVDKVSSTDNAIVRFNGTSGAVQNSSVVIDDSGNVGIGTSSPSSLLDITVSGSGVKDVLKFNTPIEVGETVRRLGISTGGGMLDSSIALGYTDRYYFYSSYIAFGTSINNSNRNIERMRIDQHGNLLVGTTTNNGVDKLQVNGGIAASEISLDGYFKIGKNYTFGDYSGIQGTRNPASMLVMVAGSDDGGAGRSALYLVNLKVLYGTSSTSSIRIAGDACVSATFTYESGDIFRVTNTSTCGGVFTWRYIGGYN